MSECFRKLVIYALSENAQLDFKIFNAEMKIAINTISVIDNKNALYSQFTKFCCDHVEKQFKLASTYEYAIFNEENSRYCLSYKDNKHIINMNATNCSCPFFTTANIICRHIIYLRRQLGLQLL